MNAEKKLSTPSQRFRHRLSTNSLDNVGVSRGKKLCTDWHSVLFPTQKKQFGCFPSRRRGKFPVTYGAVGGSGRPRKLLQLRISVRDWIGPKRAHRPPLVAAARWDAHRRRRRPISRRRQLLKSVSRAFAEKRSSCRCNRRDHSASTKADFCQLISLISCRRESGRLASVTPQVLARPTLVAEPALPSLIEYGRQKFVRRRSA